MSYVRWIDTRSYLPPKGMTVLVYMKESNEIFEDTIRSASCTYEINNKDDFEHVDIYSAKWKITTVDQKWNPKVTEQLECEWNSEDVTHWTLLPPYTSSIWINMNKYEPNRFLEVLIYMKDKGEDKEDFIISSGILPSSSHNEDTSKLRFEPVAWTLMPNLPRLIDDTFCC